MLFRSVAKRINPTKGINHWAATSFRLCHSQNIDDLVASKVPSLLWSCNTMHGLTEEQIEFRQNVRTFAEKELPEELVKKIDKDSKWDDFRGFWKRLGSMGLHGVTAPSKYGGLDLGYFEHCLALEEVSRCSGAIGLSYGAHSNLCLNQINLNGNDEQKERFLPKLIDGSFVGSLAMSETSSGSDVTSMKTNAVKKGDYYVINGSKFWITNGSEADVVVLYARTSEKGLTTFLIEKGMEGFTIGQDIDKLGMRGSPTSELLFENVKVPEKNVVGKVDGGVYVLMSGLDMERLTLAAACLGVMQSSCELAFNYAHERHQFKKPIGTFQLMQGKLADMYRTLTMSRAYLYNVVRSFDNYKSEQKASQKKPSGRSPFTKDAAAVILTVAENSTKLCLDTIQILGGNGYTNEYPAGRMLRDSKLYEIGAGTSEVRRWLIGRELNSEYI